MTQISENEYEALVYVDHMLDEDYTGRGVCHWKFMQFRVHMRATGMDGETLFIPAIPHRKLIPLETEAVYFNKNAYPRANMDNFPDTGAPRARYADWVRDEDLFSVTFIPTREDES